MELFRLWEYQKTIPHGQKLLGAYFKTYFDWKVISQLPVYVCILCMYSIHVFYVFYVFYVCMYVCILCIQYMYSMHVFYVCILSS